MKRQTAKAKQTKDRPLPNKKGRFTPNRYRIEGDTAYIELTDRQNATVAEAIIDSSDLERVISGGRWCRNQRRHTSYVGRSYRENGIARVQWLHRFLMETPEGMDTDHINGNGLDNRRANLRISTTAENRQNSVSLKPTGSGYPNVYLHNGGADFCVSVKSNGVSHSRYGLTNHQRVGFRLFDADGPLLYSMVMLHPTREQKKEQANTTDKEAHRGE